MRSFSLLLASFALCTVCVAQPVPEDWPVAAEADVESVDSIVAAVYDVISGPAGPRDWDRFRSLFRPGAKLIPIATTPDGDTFPVYWSPDEYAERASGWFSERGFFEKELHRTSENFGPMVHVFSTYESFDTAEATEPFARGINSIQLMNDGSRWWLVNIFWQSENENYPIPAAYLPGMAH